MASHRVRRFDLVTLYCFQALLFIVLIALLPAVTYAQGGGVDTTGSGGQNKVQGRIYFPSGRRSDAAVVKVKLESTSSDRLSVVADSNGSFTFQSLAPGSYQMIIDAGAEYETAKETVIIDDVGIRSRNMSGAELARINTPRTFNVMVTLQLKRATTAKASVLNAALASVPQRAREIYQKGLEAAQSGDSKMAVEHLKNAISIYPTFAVALNELGVQYLRLNQADKAAEALSAAVKVVPEEFHPRLNYGIALLNQKKFAESEEQLRAAISKNGAAPTAHMYLGITLAVQRKLDEADKELVLAISSRSTEVTLAYRYLGGVYMEKRDFQRAADHLETYLKLAPKAPDAEILRKKIKELRSKT